MIHVSLRLFIYILLLVNMLTYLFIAFDHRSPKVKSTKCRANLTSLLEIYLSGSKSPVKNLLKMSMMAYTASAAAARALVARSSLRPVASQIGAAKMDVASTQGMKTVA